MIVTIHCWSVGHATRSGREGWSDELGTVELPEGTSEIIVLQATSGFVCQGCADAYDEAVTAGQVDPAITPLEMF